MREVIGLLTNTVTATTPITGTRPSLDTDGVDVTAWRHDGTFAPMLTQIFIAGSTTLSIAAPSSGTEGVELWGYRLGAWWFVESLNGGSAIPIAGATQGYSETVTEIGEFDRLAIAGVPSTGTATAKFAALERWMY